jgi:hypothetical protein
MKRLLGKEYQGTNESIAYEVDFSAWGTVSSVTSVTISPEATLTGSASLANNIVTTPILSGLTVGILYRMLITVVVDGNTMSGYILIESEV